MPRVLDQSELDASVSTTSRDGLPQSPRKKKKRDKDEEQELSSTTDYSNRFDGPSQHFRDIYHHFYLIFRVQDGAIASTAHGPKP